MLPTDIKKEEADFLKYFLNKNQVALEWGSGWSTLEFSKYVKEYYSIEHDAEWYERVRAQALENTKIYYAPPQTEDFKWEPVYRSGSEEIFKDYIKYPEFLVSLGKKFDIVFIDGRARLFCALKTLNWLNDKAIVFIHDFDRLRYWDVLKNYRIIDIAGKMAALEKTNSKVREKDRLYLAKRYLF
jgi:hypothetical protein